MSFPRQKKITYLAHILRFIVLVSAVINAGFWSTNSKRGTSETKTRRRKKHSESGVIYFMLHVTNSITVSLYRTIRIKWFRWPLICPSLHNTFRLGMELWYTFCSTRYLFRTPCSCREVMGQVIRMYWN